MIVAHERYSQVVEQARTSTLIQPTNIEQVSTEDASKTKVIVESRSLVIEKFEEKIKENSIIMEAVTEIARIEVSKNFDENTPQDVRMYAIEKKTDEMVTGLAKEKVRELSFESYHAQQTEREQKDTPYEEGSIFAQFSSEVKSEIKISTDSMKTELELRNIPIPRLILTPHYSNISIT